MLDHAFYCFSAITIYLYDELLLLCTSISVVVRLFSEVGGGTVPNGVYSWLGHYIQVWSVIHTIYGCSRTGEAGGKMLWGRGKLLFFASISYATDLNKTKSIEN